MMVIVNKNYTDFFNAKLAIERNAKALSKKKKKKKLDVKVVDEQG